MNSKYPVRALCDIAQRIDYGLTASATDASVGPRFLRITDIVPERLDWTTVPFCRTASDEDRRKFALERGDIVIARTGATVGYSKFIRDAVDAVFASYLVRVRVNPGFDPSYVGYVVGSEDYKDFVRSNAGGAAQPNANARVLTSYLVPLPPLPTQHKIVGVLSAYDDLIENNDGRIKLLEEMTRRIYREWFVDFRYPGHETVPLVDSELGPVPKEWKVEPLGQLATLTKGLSYKGEYLTDSGIPMANLKCFDAAGGFRREGTKPYSGPFKEKHSIRPGDLIVANTDLTQAGNVIGSPAIVPERGFENGGLVSHHLFVVRPRSLGISTAFVYQALRDDRARSFARGRASGTTVLGLRTADYERYPVLVPTAPLLRRFSDVAGSCLAQCGRLEDMLGMLRTTRDLLVPHLISGTTEVGDLDIAVADAAA